MVLTTMLSNEVKLNLNRFLQLLISIITSLIHFHRISMLVFYQFIIVLSFMAFIIDIKVLFEELKQTFMVKTLRSFSNKNYIKKENHK